MLLILTCSQMLFFLFCFFVCILLNQIPAPQMMNPEYFLQTVFLWERCTNIRCSTTLIFYGKTRSLTTLLSSWIHGNKQKHLNNTQISGMIYLFHLMNRICCRNDSKSVHISVVRSVCTIMCLWPSLCMFWLYCLVHKIQIIKKYFFSISSHSLLPASKSQSHWWAISSL